MFPLNPPLDVNVIVDDDFCPGETVSWDGDAEILQQGPGHGEEDHSIVKPPTGVAWFVTIAQ